MSYFWHLVEIFVVNDANDINDDDDDDDDNDDVVATEVSKAEGRKSLNADPGNDVTGWMKRKY